VLTYPRALIASGALCVLLPVTLAAQEFSADVVFTPVVSKAVATTARPPAPTVRSAKLYVRKEQLRLETHGVTGLVMLVDGANHTTVAMFPPQKAYQPLGSRPRQYFRVADPERACADWQEAVGKKIECKKDGRETVEGRAVVKYSRALGSGSEESVWVDRKLNYVVKWRSDQGEAQLRDIKEGPQSPELFTVPQDYKLQSPRKSRSSPMER